AGGIMFPQEGRAGRPDFPRTAVAGVAGVGEDLRGGLAGIEVCLGPRRMSRRQRGGGKDPRHDQRHPRADESSITTEPEAPLYFEFWPKRGCDLPGPLAVISPPTLLQLKPLPQPRDFVLILASERGSRSRSGRGAIC